MTKAVKEIIIMLLITLVAMLGLAIGLYQYIPSKKTVPEIKQYEVSEQVQDLLEDNIDQKSDSDRVILTYEVTKSDLSGYQKTNNYIPGKSNPFADVSKTITEDGESNTSINNNEENTNLEDKTETKVKPSNPSVFEETGTK